MGTAYGISNCVGWYKASAGVFSDAGATAAANGGVVEQWNDQSGAGNHLTQTTPANCPTYVSASAANGLPAIHFEAVVGLNLPVSIALNTQAFTVFFVSRSPAVDNSSLLSLGSGLPLVATSTATPQAFIGLNLGGGTYVFPPQKTVVAQNVDVNAIAAGPTAITFYYNNYAGASSPLASANTAGGRLGSFVGGGFNFLGEMYEVLVFNAALTAAQAQTVLAGLKAAYSIPTYTAQVVCGIDSITYGHAGGGAPPTGVSWPDQMLSGGFVPPTCKVVNEGITGQQLANTSASTYTQLVAFNLFGNTTNLFVLLGGVNDLLNGKTDVQVYASIASLCQTLRNAGVRVVVCQILPAGFTAQQQTYWQSVNAQLAANWPTFADAFVPIPALLSSSSNATYFQTDGLHLTQAGSAVMAAAAGAAVKSLLTAGAADSPGVTTLLARLPLAVSFDGAGNVKSASQTPVTVGTNNDKAGYALSAAGVAAAQGGLSTFNASNTNVTVGGYSAGQDAASLVLVGGNKVDGSRLDVAVSTRLAGSAYAPPPGDYQQRGQSVTLPATPPSGYGGGGGGGSSPLTYGNFK